jgi:hypothetical protein
MPMTAIRLSWPRVSLWRPLARAQPQSTAAAVSSMTESTVMTGRPSTAYLYAVFHKAKTTDAAIRGTTPPRCLIMSRMSSRPRVSPLPVPP